jgi:hypothetical protein
MLRLHCIHHLFHVASYFTEMEGTVSKLYGMNCQIVLSICCLISYPSAISDRLIFNTNVQVLMIISLFYLEDNPCWLQNCNGLGILDYKNLENIHVL